MASRYKRNPNTAGRVIEGQAHVVTAEHSKMHTLNETATVLWELAASGCTIEEAARALSERFEVDPATARSDVEACFQDMVARNILVVEP